MKLNNFFRVSWMVQLMVGVGLFSVSFFIESHILQAFLSVPLLALFLALTLEAGKAATIIWHRYMTMQPVGTYSLITRILSSVFRVGLLVLSLLCSVLYLADHLDRPYLKEVLSEELHTVQQQLDQELARLDSDKRERLKSLKEWQTTEYENTKQSYGIRQQELEGDLKNEMDNVVRGVFKGPRYAEFEHLIKEQKAERKADLEAMAMRHFSEKAALDLATQNELDTARASAIAKAEHQRKALLAKDFATDERVNDPRIVAFLKISESVFHLEIQPLQFIFVFSLLLSALMEVCIMLAFDTVTVAMLPALKAQQEEDVAIEILKSEVASEAKREEIKHESTIDRVAKRADRTVKEAEDMVDKFKNLAA